MRVLVSNDSGRHYRFNFKNTIIDCAPFSIRYINIDSNEFDELKNTLKEYVTVTPTEGIRNRINNNNESVDLASMNDDDDEEYEESNIKEEEYHINKNNLEIKDEDSEELEEDNSEIEELKEMLGEEGIDELNRDEVKGFLDKLNVDYNGRLGSKKLKDKLKKEIENIKG